MPIQAGVIRRQNPDNHEVWKGFGLQGEETRTLKAILHNEEWFSMFLINASDGFEPTLLSPSYHYFCNAETHVW
ncbi:hypothetical protein CVN76_18870 [Bacillus sp. mrc49]|nr:hypothetical protein CVN76_18870 [Bacillus sp. mrc49]